MGNNERAKSEPETTPSGVVEMSRSKNIVSATLDSRGIKIMVSKSLMDTADPAPYSLALETAGEFTVVSLSDIERKWLVHILQAMA